MEYYGEFTSPNSLVTLENSHLHTLENNGASTAIAIGNECWDMDISAATGSAVSEKKNKFVTTTIDGKAVRGWCEIIESYTYEGCVVTEKIYYVSTNSLNYKPIYVRNGYLAGADPDFETNYSSIIWTSWKMVGTLDGSLTKLSASITSKSSVVNNGSLSVAVFKHANKWADVKIYGQLTTNQRVTLSPGWDTQISVNFGSNSTINNLFKNVNMPTAPLDVFGPTGIGFRLLNVPLNGRGGTGVGFGGIQVTYIPSGTSSYAIGSDCSISFDTTMTIPL